MLELTFINRKEIVAAVPEELLRGKRRLTQAEIATLAANRNSSDDGAFANLYVDASDGGFDSSLIRDSRFSGFVVLGRLCAAKLKYHELELETGIYRSHLKNVVTGSDNAIHNAAHLENYRLGERVVLFNIQEMACTAHSKFGNGIVKDGEDEKSRTWISVRNENGGREVLPFENMIAADAYIWSKFREDKALMRRLVELTENESPIARGTFGTVGNDTVIKNTTVVKDAKIGEAAYIKGAFKLKNITVRSSAAEPSQIGEGVELVNGIMGLGSRVFYQAVGIRFVIGNNCQLKYGARLINSVLGDNSTVSCCELLNNLIFPFHEQHHNSSFLIAAMIMGQSNIAAGATIGSNHNSRSPDGEITAGRGFWSGLCTSFKHNSRFAPFTLAAKGSYQYELNVPYPFALVTAGDAADSPVNVVPAWQFMHNMFAVARNKYKFDKRDTRVTKIQQVETNPLAPDTMEYVESARRRLADLCAASLEKLAPERYRAGMTADEALKAAEAFLAENPEREFTLFDAGIQKRFGGIVHKAAQAFAVYSKAIKYFAACALIDYSAAHKIERLSADALKELKKRTLYDNWDNAGGQIIAAERLRALFERIKSGLIRTWDEVHAFYAECQTFYADDKARYALALLERLYKKDAERFSGADLTDFVSGALAFSGDMYAKAVASRKKDFTDPFRTMSYRNAEEMAAALGTIDDVGFLKDLRADKDAFAAAVEAVFGRAGEGLVSAGD
ncbi:MAG: DUF4954 family protein [Treponema sp.]